MKKLFLAAQIVLLPLNLLASLDASSFQLSYEGVSSNDLNLEFSAQQIDVIASGSSPWGIVNALWVTDSGDINTLSWDSDWTISVIMRNSVTVADGGTYLDSDGDVEAINQAVIWVQLITTAAGIDDGSDIIEIKLQDHNGVKRIVVDSEFANDDYGISYSPSQEAHIRLSYDSTAAEITSAYSYNGSSYTDLRTSSVASLASYINGYPIGVSLGAESDNVAINAGQNYFKGFTVTGTPAAGPPTSLAGKSFVLTQLTGGLQSVPDQAILTSSTMSSGFSGNLITSGVSYSYSNGTFTYASDERIDLVYTSSTSGTYEEGEVGPDGTFYVENTGTFEEANVSLSLQTNWQRSETFNSEISTNYWQIEGTSGDSVAYNDGELNFIFDPDNGYTGDQEIELQYAGALPLDEDWQIVIDDTYVSDSVNQFSVSYQVRLVGSIDCEFGFGNQGAGRGVYFYGFNNPNDNFWSIQYATTDPRIQNSLNFLIQHLSNTRELIYSYQPDGVSDWTELARVNLSTGEATGLTGSGSLTGQFPSSSENLFFQIDVEKYSTEAVPIKNIEIGGIEIGTYPPPVIPVDSDGDGLHDSIETNTGVYVSTTDTGTNPNDADTDSDGLSDGDEVSNGTDPNDPNSPLPPGPQIPVVESYGNTELLEDSSGYYAGSISTPLIYNGIHLGPIAGFSALGVDLYNGQYRLVLFNGRQYLVKDFNTSGVGQGLFSAVSDISAEEIKLSQDLDGNGHVGSLPIAPPASIAEMQFEFTIGNGIIASAPFQEFYGSDGVMNLGFSNSIFERVSYTYNNGAISFPQFEKELRLTFAGADSGTFEYYDVYDLNNEQLEYSGTFSVVTPSLEVKTDWERAETLDNALSTTYWNVIRREVDSLVYDDGELNFIFGSPNSPIDTEINYARTLPMNEDWQVVVDDIYAAPELNDFKIEVDVEIASTGFELEIFYEDNEGGRRFGANVGQYTPYGWQSAGASVTSIEDERVSSGGNIRVAHIASTRELIFEYQPEGANDWSELANFNLTTGAFQGQNNSYGSNFTGGLVNAISDRLSVDIEAFASVATQVGDLEIGGIEIGTYTPPTTPVDSDGDGLDDSVETNTGIYVSPSDTGTDPNNADTDGDGINDGDEVTNGTDPNIAPTNYLPSSRAGTVEVSYSDEELQDPVINPEYHYFKTSSELYFLDYEEGGLHTYTWDSLTGRLVDNTFDEYIDYIFTSDNTGTYIFDGVSTDTGTFVSYDANWDLDYNGTADGAQIEAGNLLGAGVTHPINLQSDADSDGLTLAQEGSYGTDPNNADTDGDAFGDGDEIDEGTDPNYNPNTDSDGDGVSDSLELADGTDPNNSNEYNSTSVGIIAYYPFNGNANDESLYVVENQDAKNGIVYGASLGLDRNGVADSSYDFDGINDYIDLGDPDILDLSYSNYTYSLWFRTDATTDNYYILSKYQTDGANAFGIGTTGRDYLYSFFVGDNHSDAVELNSTKNINDGAWHHVVMALDLDNFEYNLYLDGVLEETKSFPATSSGIDSYYPLLIGKQVNGQNFDGSIDDLRVYNRVLSGAEVTTLYEFELSPPNNNMDTDNDGLLNSVESNTGIYVNETDTGTDPNNWDSSGDGLIDGAVVSAGFNPNVDYSSIITIVQNSTVDMNLNSLRLERSGNGAFNMNFDLEMSTDLETWTPHTSHSIDLSVPDQSKTFMRINVK